MEDLVRAAERESRVPLCACSGEAASNGDRIGTVLTNGTPTAVGELVGLSVVPVESKNLGARLDTGDFKRHAPQQETLRSGTAIMFDAAATMCSTGRKLADNVPWTIQ